MAAAKAKKTVLKVLEEPDDTFYMAEGGKSNHLHCVIGTTEPLTCKVPLAIDLYFESELRVEESDQCILNLLKNKFERYELSPAEPKVTINFRLEKVSRRKDGQRFKVHVTPDLEAMTAVDAGGLAGTGGVFTSPVIVMSKRRTGERFVSRPRPSRDATAPVPQAMVDMMNAVSGQVAGVQATLDTMIALLHKQDSRLAALEGEVYSMARAAIMPRATMPQQHPGAWSSHYAPPPSRVGLPGASAALTAMSIPTGVALTTASHPGGLPGAMPPPAATPTLPDGGGHTGGMKRIRSSDVQFNFGGDGGGGAGGEETTVPPPMPGGPVGGQFGHLGRFTSLDHSYSVNTLSSGPPGMGMDERVALDVLASARKTSGAVQGGGKRRRTTG